ncbi:MAG: hypothetical protein ACKVU2_01300 [Saprospiraceae bacterium]
MLALFRNNQSTTVFLLALYLILLRLPALLGWVQPQEHLGEQDGGQLYRTLFGWAEASAFASAFAAAVIVFGQAVLVNRLADFYRIMDDRTWLPGTLYIAAASCIPDFLFLSPTLVATTFIPLALHRIFSVYRQTLAFGAIFDAAFWTVLAAFFHPPAIWCIGAAFLSLFSLRSFSTREQFIFLTGILVPLVLALTSYFWVDQAGQFGSQQIGRSLFWPSVGMPDSLFATLKAILIAILFVACLLGFNVYYYKRLIQVQKYVTIFYWFLFASFLAALFQFEWHSESLLLAAPSIGIFLAYLFQASRNTKLLELFHLFLLIAIFIIQFYPKLAQTVIQ